MHIQKKNIYIYIYTKYIFFRNHTPQVTACLSRRRGDPCMPLAVIQQSSRQYLDKSEVLEAGLACDENVRVNPSTY